MSRSHQCSSTQVRSSAPRRRRWRRSRRTTWDTRSSGRGARPRLLLSSIARWSWTPNFAEAYVHLANVHGNAGRTQLGAENATKAYALRDRVSERERYHVLVAYHLRVTGDLLKRTELGEMWKSMYPRDGLCRNNLSGAYGSAGRYGEALEEARQAVALDPSSLSNHTNAASYVFSLGRLTDAKTLHEEAGRRFPDYHGHHAALYRIALLQGDAAEAQRQLDWAKGKPEEATFVGYRRQQDAQAGRLEATARAREAGGRRRRAKADGVELDVRQEFGAGRPPRAGQRRGAGRPEGVPRGPDTNGDGRPRARAGG